MLKCLVFFFSVFIYTCPLSATLLDNLQKAQKGDYIVTAQGKNYTLMHIYDRKENILTVEEITAPSKIFQGKSTLWKAWIMQGAPYHTAWVMYSIDLKDGKMKAYYSLTKNRWVDMSKVDNFLTTLLNLNMLPIPFSDRKKVGLQLLKKGNRPLWQPKMIVEGREISGVFFDAFRTKWPNDNSELSGKVIEVYVPRENERYPSYFPYWLEISGVVGNAKIRIIDSGSKMDSPAPPLRKP